MRSISGRYFDGHSSVPHEATVVLAGGKLKVIGRAVSAELDARAVRRSLRIADTPRWLYLPGGGAFVTADNDAADALMAERRYDRLLQAWESRPAYAAVAAAMLLATVWLLVFHGLPAAVEQVAARIPVHAEAALGRESLQGVDRFFAEPSALPPERQRALREKLYYTMDAAADRTAYRLEFRSGRYIGPNAFALPSGIIVMTDELVKLAKKDQEILAVLAHEIGHVRHRHAMRRLLEGSVTALLAAAVTGDLSAIGSLAAAAPTVLLQASHSRDNEREADAYAVQLLSKAGLDPAHLGAILVRLEESAGPGERPPAFLSTHPATSERQALARAGRNLAEQEEPAFMRTPAIPAARTRPASDPLHRQIAALLGQGQFQELERQLSALQQAFEADPARAEEVRHAFLAFGKLPPAAKGELDHWLKSAPGSYAARVARGSFHLGRALPQSSRSVQDDEDERPSIRGDELGFAKADLGDSIAYAKKPLVSRLWLITIARYSRDRESAARHYGEAVRMAPQYADVRLEYLKSLEPRSGGSDAEMRSFVERSRAELKDPIAQNKLAARIPAYRGYRHRIAKDYGAALAALNEALALHEDPAGYCSRSFVLGQLKRHGEAFSDATKAVALSGAAACLEQAVHAARSSERWQDIIRLMTVLVESDAGAAGAYRERARAYYASGRKHLALQDYGSAADLGDAGAQVALGRLYLSGDAGKQDREAGIAWLKKADAQGEATARKALLEQGLLK